MPGDVMRWPVVLPYSPAINNTGGIAVDRSDYVQVACFVAALLGKRLALPPALSIALTCLLTVGIAHALHLAVERPAVRRVRALLAARGLA